MYSVFPQNIAADGEGATHLITCRVSGAKDEASAETVGKFVISSMLLKAVIFDADANGGRVLCAMGYSGVDFVSKHEVEINITMGEGKGRAVCWVCDITYDYIIKINGDY